MSSKPLQTQSLLDLIDLFERSGQPIADDDGQRLRGVPGWSALGRKSLTPKLLEQWTDCVGYAGSYPASLDDDLVQVDLTEDDQLKMTKLIGIATAALSLFGGSLSPLLKSPSTAFGQLQS
jgi:hypothetical protein